MFDIPSKLKLLQDALVFNDKEMADFLGVDLTVYRESKCGTQELSSHGVAIALDVLGLVELTNPVMMLLTKRAREKLIEALSKRSLSEIQKNSLTLLRFELSKDRTPLAQYDLDQSSDYQKGFQDGRLQGFEVGQRYAKEAILSSEAEDPLQGAVDWFLYADGDLFSVSNVQRSLRIGYNRANRLAEVARERVSLKKVA